MQSELLFPFSLLTGFLLVLARVSAVFAFLPIPGSQTGPPIARVVLSLACTVALYPLWPVIPGVPTMSQIVAWVLIEAVLGTAAGVIFAYIAEAFVLGAQILSLQAGYAYASTIDPNTQADSGILMILVQLVAGMLFFTAGLDRHVIAAFAASLESYPPGTFLASPAVAHQVISAGGAVFTLASRIALPVMAILLMADLALGVLGRINAQLQAGSASFPLKMMLVLAMLATMIGSFPALHQTHAGAMFKVMRSVIAPR